MNRETSNQAPVPDNDRLERQRKVAEALGVPVCRRHIFLCCDQAKPKCADRQRTLEAWQYLKRRLKELGLSEQGGIYRTKADCLRICMDGPMAVVYPEGAWYRRCDPPVLETNYPGNTWSAGVLVREHLIIEHVLDPG